MTPEISTAQILALVDGNVNSVFVGLAEPTASAASLKLTVLFSENAIVAEAQRRARGRDTGEIA